MQKPSQPVPSGWDLHFDVSHACAGDMLAGALLDLGAPESALRQGLLDAGLHGVGPRITREQRGGLLGTRVVFVDHHGRALEEADDPTSSHTREGGPRENEKRGARRPGPSPHRDHRTTPAAVEVKLAASGPDDEAKGADILTGPKGTFQKAVKNAAKGKASATTEDQGVPGQVAKWINDDVATGGELLAVVKNAHLPPVTTALAHRALRRLLEARAQVRGEEIERQEFAGRGALDMLCDVIGVCALVRALDPSRITCSRVTVSTAPVWLDGFLQPGPAPWLLACLDGLRLDEQDLPHASITPTGAALLSALCRSSGPRGFVRERHRGIGHGTRQPRALTNVCRAMLSEPPVLLQGEGAEPRGARWRLEALLDPAHHASELHAKLVAAGAQQLTSAAVTDHDGHARTRLCLLVSEHHLEAVHRLLLVASANSLVQFVVQEHAAGEREVTVALGSAMKKQPVRIIETVAFGEVVRAQPHHGDLERAAKILGLPASTLLWDAMSTWRRLQSVASPRDEQKDEMSMQAPRDQDDQ